MQSENTQPENIQSNSLPDNAYRELRPGEEYHPVMPAASRPKEVTLYSVLFGIVMCIAPTWGVDVLVMLAGFYLIISGIMVLISVLKYHDL